MDYEKLWKKLKGHIEIEESDLTKHDVLDLMEMFEDREVQSDKNRTNLGNNPLFEKSETGNYNPKPF